MTTNHIDVAANDWDLCLTGSSVTAISAAGSQRRTSNQLRGDVTSARSQYSHVSIGYWKTYHCWHHSYYGQFNLCEYPEIYFVAIQYFVPMLLFAVV